MGGPVGGAAHRLATLRGWRRGVAAAVLGALAALALPPLFLLPVLPLAFTGLLALIGSAPGLKAAAAAGFWFGCGLYGVGLYWITDAILVQAAAFWWLVPLAVPGLAAVLGLFVAVPCLLARLARPGLPRAAVLAGAWVLADLLRQFVLTGFPWNPLGSVLELPGLPGDVLIQPAALVGVPGLTLAVLLGACAPAAGRRAASTALLLAAAWITYGLYRLPPPSSDPAPPALQAVLVQGDIDVREKHDRDEAIRSFDTYLGLTAQGIAQTTGPPRLVIWPETASPFLLDRDPGARAAIAAAAPGSFVLAGTVRFDAAGRPRNSLVVLDGAGPPAALYDKWHLVPFGEYQPSWARVGVQLVEGDGFAPGPGPRTLHVPGLPAIGPLICYEAIFPGHVVDERDRPALMVNITNDAWFGDSSGPRQHLAAARMRAVEEGLPLLRAANTGISAAFDAWGRARGRLDLGRRGVLVLGLDLRRPSRPLFSRAGLALPGALAALCLLLGLAWRPRPAVAAPQGSANHSYPFQN
jgi:apolipoprotein N-acyltransferase